MNQFFQNHFQSKIIDGELLLASWLKSLVLKDDGNSLLSLSEDNKKRIQQLSSYSKTLWNMFNQEDRKDFDKHYMESLKGVEGYMASYFLGNIERTFALCTRKDCFESLRNFFEVEQESFYILDFGAGPLSASLGFLFALDRLFSEYKDLVLPKEIKIFAVERNDRIYEFGLNILKNSLVFKNINCVNLTSLEKIPVECDVAFSSNIFNEIPKKHRLKTLKTLYSKLKKEAISFIVEPGQSVHAKDLSDLRDELLLETENAKNIHILFPCLHKAACPLSTKTKRLDWCWFKHIWEPPQAQLSIDKLTKVDRAVLNYSAFVFKKSELIQDGDSDFFARVVSDVIPMDLSNHPERKTFFLKNLVNESSASMIAQVEVVDKFLLCTKKGELNSLLLEATPYNKYFRGETVRHEKERDVLVRER